VGKTVGSLGGDTNCLEKESTTNSLTLTVWNDSNRQEVDQELLVVGRKRLKIAQEKKRAHLRFVGGFVVDVYVDLNARVQEPRGDDVSVVAKVFVDLSCDASDTGMVTWRRESNQGRSRALQAVDVV
jgi:hypothetical protein